MYVKDPLLSESQGTFVPLSDGESGVNDTLAVMSKMVRDSLADPAVKGMAVRVSEHVRPTDRNGYIRAVWDGIRYHMKYVPDVWKTEEVTSPAVHSRRIVASGKSWGDCDDFSVLGAAWLLALGVPARLKVLASPKNGGKFDHVRAEAMNADGKWVPLETTMKKIPFGRGVPALREKNYEV